MKTVDFNPVCSVCGETISCDDVLPDYAPLCDKCWQEWDKGVDEDERS